MTLHVDSSTIRNQSVIAHVLDPADPQTQSDTDGTTLSGDPGSTSDVNAVNDAEALVRSISSRLSTSSSATAAALHGSIDRSRAAALLVD
jgi:hypothetical protein